MHEASWPEELREKFADLKHRVVLERVDPPGVRLTLEEFLHRDEIAPVSCELEDAFRTYELRQSLARCPVIGVVGELNAGKSSVAAVFLSEEGRRRIPRGFEDRFATHRFVYWVPVSWQEDDRLWRQFLYLLSLAHGHTRYELLPTDPDAAAETYASGEHDPDLFGTPVIAFDEGLDRLGVALLDCPDVQTETAGESWQRQGKTRLDFLAEASGLCSAVLFVCQAEHVRAGTIKEAFRRIRERTRGVPLFLLVNRLEASSQVWTMLADIGPLLEMAEASSGVYVAFDYRHQKWESYVPERVRTASMAWKTHLGDSGDEKQRLPVFFRLPDGILKGEAVGPEQVLDRVGEQDVLEALPGRLQSGKIQQEALSEATERVRRVLRTFTEAVRGWTEERRKVALDMRRGLVAFLASQFTSGEGKPVGPVSESLLRDFDAAMRRTAPWWAKAAMWVRGKAENLRESASKLLPRLPRLPGRSSASADVDGRFSAAAFASRMYALRWVPTTVAETALEKAWEKAWASLARAEATLRHDPQVLDEPARQAWQQLALAQKLQLSLAWVAPVCLFLALIDGGAALLLALSKSSVLITLSQLPGTVLAVVSLTGGTLGALARPALADAEIFFSALFWGACDVFGIARFDDTLPQVTIGDHSFVVHPPHLVGMESRLPVQCPLDALAGVYQCTKPFDQLLTQCESVSVRGGYDA